MSGVTDLVVEDGDGVTVAVHVQPGAGKTSVVGRHGDALKLRVAAPPVDDRANTAAIALLAEVLGVKARSIQLVSGARSRVKRLHVSGLDHDEALERIELAIDDASTPPGPPRRRPGAG